MPAAQLDLMPDTHPDNMSDLVTRIRRVTEDLKAIQEKLNAAAQPGAPPAERERIMEALLQADMVNEFKTAVDNMRHLLWSYIEAASAKSPQNVTRTLQAVRMQRVTEMLRILQPTVDEVEMASTPEARSFFDVIHKIANSTVDRHSDEAGPKH